MRQWAAIVLMFGVVTGCGGSAGTQNGDALTQDVLRQVEGLQELLERMQTDEGAARGEMACDALRSGILVEVFGEPAMAATFQPGSRFIPHALCRVFWDKPNREELEAAAIDYEMRRMTATLQGREFNEPSPPSPRYEVSLTIVNQTYDSAADAVAGLEDAVAQISAGIPVEEAGGALAQTDFETWIEGVGDRAAWAPHLSELSVAHAGVRYAVSAQGFGDAAENKANAIRLAQRVAQGI